MTITVEAIYENGMKLIVSNKERGGVTWEGTEGSVWADRGKHDANPKKILDEKIGPNEVHLYESANHYRNFIDCVKSRKPTAAPWDCRANNAIIERGSSLAIT